MNGAVRGVTSDPGVLQRTEDYDIQDIYQREETTIWYGEQEMKDEASS